MLMMIEKGIRGGICQAIHWYAKANNKYIKNYEKKKSSYEFRCKKRNACERLYIKKKLSKFDEYFIKSYDEDSDKGYIFEIDAEYPKTLRSLHSDHTLLAERMKLKNATSLLVIYMTKNYVVHIRSLKQALNHGLILTNVHKKLHIIKKHS